MHNLYMNAMNTTTNAAPFFTVSNMDGKFPSLFAAVKAWQDAGKPGQRNDRVWVTESVMETGKKFNCAITVRTVVIR